MNTYPWHCLCGQHIIGPMQEEAHLEACKAKPMFAPPGTRPLATAKGDPILQAEFMPGSDGTVDGWLVLCFIGARNDVHPFVVWWMRADSGQTFTGHYRETLRDALETYEAMTAGKGLTS